MYILDVQPRLFVLDGPMAGRITRLAFQKHAADRVNVYLDGQYAFALPALDAARLGMGEYLDDDAIARLQTQDERQKAYDRALRFLSFRPRSQAEVRRNLLAAGLDAELVEATLARLAAQGYLDDAEFARFWVENRQQFRPKGSVALRGELRQRGVAAETVDAALSDLDPAAGAYEAAHPRAIRLAALAQADPAAFRRKLGDFLLRRGFDYEVVKETVARLLRETQDLAQ
jgi:regulatory protein